MFSDDYYDWTKLAGLEAKAAIQCQQAEIVRLQKRLEALRKAASPVTDNPTEDAADTDKKTNEWMVCLPESIHDWPKWFVPDWSVWKDWKSV